MQIEEVPAFSSSTNQALDDLVKQFALEEALEVKKVRDMQRLLAEAHRALADHHPEAVCPWRERLHVFSVVWY